MRWPVASKAMHTKLMRSIVGEYRRPEIFCLFHCLWCVCHRWRTARHKTSGTNVWRWLVLFMCVTHRIGYVRKNNHCRRRQHFPCLVRGKYRARSVLWEPKPASPIQQYWQQCHIHYTHTIEWGFRTNLISILCSSAALDSFRLQENLPKEAEKKVDDDQMHGRTVQWLWNNSRHCSWQTTNMWSDRRPRLHGQRLRHERHSNQQRLFAACAYAEQQNEMV